MPESFDPFSPNNQKFLLLVLMHVDIKSNVLLPQHHMNMCTNRRTFRNSWTLTPLPNAQASPKVLPGDASQELKQRFARRLDNDVEQGQSSSLVPPLIHSGNKSEAVGQSRSLRKNKKRNHEKTAADGVLRERSDV
ncbi:hypothetical protein Dda_3964 [Drechslerella dactyloides]|uniref:Uncharacterized protein n=1 Tax=Drechslerella dactyloides TaxID=74499 RepID=A0AAD6NKD8_DREDA|nr:hypothetical protein Dda_3964 [Drechslerella dactyloides]